MKTRIDCTQLIVRITMSDLGFELGNLGSFFWLWMSLGLNYIITTNSSDEQNICNPDSSPTAVFEHET